MSQRTVENLVFNTKRTLRETPKSSLQLHKVGK